MQSTNHDNILACLGGSGDWVTVRTNQDGVSEEPGSIPRSDGRFCVQIPGVHASRFISRAGRGFDSVLYNLW